MKTIWSITALVALASEALGQHVLEFNLNRGLPGVLVGLGVPHHIARRETHTGSLANNITGGAYFIDAVIGTPGQHVSMVLDTGSSDAWVVAAKADLCRSPQLQQHYQQTCYGTYNPAQSSSYKLLSQNTFDILYLDGGGAAGDFITDDFTIAGTTIESLQVGYAKQTSRGTGILGIGFNSSVSSKQPYPNIIDQLQTQGKIATKAYSLYLNDRRTDTGSILFGGIDKGKFIGPLSVIPILKETSTAIPRSFEVEFNSMTLDSSNGTVDVSVPKSNKPFPAVLDSGSTLSYIPDEMAKKIFAELGAFTDKVATQLTLVDCDYLASEPNLTLSFTFGDGAAKIAVPVWEMVLDLLAGYEALIPKEVPFKRACVLGLQSTAGFEEDRVANIDFALLGETFLRSAYVVYDLTHHQIGMAQANLNSTDVDIVEFKVEDTSIPTVTGVAAQQTTNPPRGTGTERDGPATHTVTVTASPNAGPGAAAMLPGGGRDAIAVLIITSMFTLVGGALMVF